jgi:hypothetical protein
MTVKSDFPRGSRTNPEGTGGNTRRSPNGTHYSLTNNQADMLDTFRRGGNKYGEWMTFTTRNDRRVCDSLVRMGFLEIDIVDDDVSFRLVRCHRKGSA